VGLTSFSPPQPSPKVKDCGNGVRKFSDMSFFLQKMISFRRVTYHYCLTMVRNKIETSKVLSDQIYHALLVRICNGQYAIGSALPPVRKIAKEFSTSISPVYAAMAALEKEGFVNSIHGSMIRVESDKPVRRSIRSHPVVDVVTSLGPSFTGSEIGVAPHLLDAIQQMLIAILSRDGGIRITLSSFFDTQGKVTFSERLEDARQLKPQVFVFAKPEEFGDTELSQMMRLKAHGTHIVYYAARRDVPEFDRVYSDFACGQRLLTEYLLARNSRPLIRFSGGAHMLYEQQKQDGFLNAFQAAGLSLQEGVRSTIQLSGLPHPSWRQVEFMIRIMRPLFEGDDRPKAIMAVSDGHAASIRLALRILGITGVIVTGYDANWVELSNRGGVLEDISEESFPEELSRENPPVSVDTCLPEISKALARLVLGRARGKFANDPMSEVTPQRLHVAGA